MKNSLALCFVNSTNNKFQKNDELQRGFCLLSRLVVRRIKKLCAGMFRLTKANFSAYSHANISLLRVIAVLGFGVVRNDAEVRLRQMCTSKLFMSSYLKQTSEIDLCQQTFYLEAINQTDETWSRQNDVTSHQMSHVWTESVGHDLILKRKASAENKVNSLKRRFYSRWAIS